MRVKVFWYSGRGWTEYLDKSIAQAARKSLGGGAQSFDTRINGVRYNIDFKKLKQRRMGQPELSRRIKIECIPEKPKTATSVSVCRPCAEEKPLCMCDPQIWGCCPFTGTNDGPPGCKFSKKPAKGFSRGAQRRASETSTRDWCRYGEHCGFGAKCWYRHC